MGSQMNHRIFNKFCKLLGTKKDGFFFIVNQAAKYLYFRGKYYIHATLVLCVVTTDLCQVMSPEQFYPFTYMK